MDDKYYIARKVLETVPLVMRTVAAEMRQDDHFFSPAHFHLLLALNHRACSLSELAEHQSVSLPTMSNSVTILEERGWAQRRRSAEDRRKVIIEITESGQQMLQSIHDQAEKRVADILDGLTDTEFRQIEAGLAVLRDAFIRDMRHEYCSPKSEFNRAED